MWAQGCSVSPQYPRTKEPFPGPLPPPQKKRETSHKKTRHDILGGSGRKFVFSDLILSHQALFFCFIPRERGKKGQNWEIIESECDSGTVKAPIGAQVRANVSDLLFRTHLAGFGELREVTAAGGRLERSSERPGLIPLQAQGSG